MIQSEYNPIFFTIAFFYNIYSICYKIYNKMTKTDSIPLLQFLALHEQEIILAFINGNDMRLLIHFQQILVSADEDDINSFISFMAKLGYTEISFQQSDKFKSINKEAYMALLNTAKARITLLHHLREQQHKNIPTALDLLAI